MQQADLTTINTRQAWRLRLAQVRFQARMKKTVNSELIASWRKPIVVGL
jgi:ribosomal protein L29